MSQDTSQSGDDIKGCLIFLGVCFGIVLIFMIITFIFDRGSPSSGITLVDYDLASTACQSATGLSFRKINGGISSIPGDRDLVPIERFTNNVEEVEAFLCMEEDEISSGLTCSYGGLTGNFTVPLFKERVKVRLVDANDYVILGETFFTGSSNCPQEAPVGASSVISFIDGSTDKRITEWIESRLSSEE